MPPSLTDRTACPGLELPRCELLANPAAVADVEVLTVHITPSYCKLYHARTTWVKTLVNPCLISGPNINPSSAVLAGPTALSGEACKRNVFADSVPMTLPHEKVNGWLIR
jgi:hypothetical protein